MSDLTFEEFRTRATPVKRLDYGSLGPEGMLLYWSNGLGGESGEVQNVVKKMVRDGHAPELDVALLDEAGDTLFYLTWLLARQGYSLEDAARHCITKLDRKRQEKEDG
jgi:phosphoribosyl-ATP pyrophosphohydrolase